MGEEKIRSRGNVAKFSFANVIAVTFIGRMEERKVKIVSKSILRYYLYSYNERRSREMNKREFVVCTS